MEISTSEHASVLLVSENPMVLENTRKLLQNSGLYSVFILTDSRATVPFLEQHPVSLIILDMAPASESVGLLARIRKEFSDIPVIVETSSSDVYFAVNCMKSGVVDYLIRPFEPASVIIAVESALDSGSLKQDMKDYLLNDRLKHAEAFSEIKTCSRKMRSMFQYTEIVARSPQTVLITGETGVGKELFARAIHRVSRVRGLFVSINVAGLDDAMFSDTLFGHKKGAFTGADQFRDGLVSKAAMGTLFLDEIGDLNELSQVKLLRLLQEREYYPVGADMLKNSTARIILATNVDLHERMKEGKFRRDLYYRLCTHQIHIPALRERREDIPLLLSEFVDNASRNFGKIISEVSPKLVKSITDLSFPGNVRELQAIVNDAVARNKNGVLSHDDFSGIFTDSPQHTPQPHGETNQTHAGIYSLFGRLPTFREVEDYLIIESLKLSEGNYAVAASILGVTRQTISKRLKLIR